MTIGKICQRDVDLADCHESARVAAERMEARNVGSLVVLDREESPIGILTDRDLALRVVARGRNPDEVLVDDVMTPFPDTVQCDTPIENVLELMRVHGVRRLPVVESDEQLIGIVSLDDILLLLAQEFAQVRQLLEKSSPRAVAKEGATR